VFFQAAKISGHIPKQSHMLSSASLARPRFFTRFDVLLAPISPTAAFPHDQRPIRRRKLKRSDGHEIAYIEMLKWIALATVCGLPATAIPAALNAQGLRG
jgi:amidase